MLRNWNCFSATVSFILFSTSFFAAAVEAGTFRTVSVSADVPSRTLDCTDDGVLIVDLVYSATIGDDQRCGTSVRQLSDSLPEHAQQLLERCSFQSSCRLELDTSVRIQCSGLSVQVQNVSISYTCQADVTVCSGERTSDSDAVLIYNSIDEAAPDTCTCDFDIQDPSKFQLFAIHSSNEAPVNECQEVDVISSLVRSESVLCPAQSMLPLVKELTQTAALQLRVQKGTGRHLFYYTYAGPSIVTVACNNERFLLFVKDSGVRIGTAITIVLLLLLAAFLLAFCIYKKRTGRNPLRRPFPSVVLVHQNVQNVKMQTIKEFWKSATGSAASGQVENKNNPKKQKQKEAKAEPCADLEDDGDLYDELVLPAGSQKRPIPANSTGFVAPRIAITTTDASDDYYEECRSNPVLDEPPSEAPPPPTARGVKPVNRDIKVNSNSFYGSTS